MEEKMRLSEAILEESMIGGLVSVLNRKLNHGDTVPEIKSYITTMIDKNELDPNLADKATPTERDAFIRIMSNPTIKKVIDSDEAIKNRFSQLKSNLSRPGAMPGEEEDKSLQVAPSKQGQRAPQNRGDAQTNQAFNTLQSEWMKATPEQKAEIQRQYMTNPYKKRIFAAAIKRGIISYKQ